jgi:hypothetical protein
MDGQPMLAGPQTPHGFIDRAANILRSNVAKQEEPAGVGMPAQTFVIVFARQDVKRGMFQGVVAPGCKVWGQIKDRIKYRVHFTIKNEDSHPKVTAFA